VNNPPLFTGAKPEDFSTRLNVASNRLSDGTGVSRMRRTPIHGSIGRSESGAGKRSERGRLGRLAKDGVVWATLNNRPNDRLARASNSPMPGEHMHMRVAIKASLTVDQILRLFCIAKRRTLLAIRSVQINGVCTHE
jgi:hypothetical protein